ncbi:hypothetical protein Tco_0486458 [Tanacetum coccineum]
MLLDFDDVQDVSDDEIEVNMKGKEKVGDEDLSKPFKEVLKCPFSRRIVEFLSPGHRMPANAKIYDGTGDLEDHVGLFVGMGNQGEWPMPVWCRIFQQTLDGKARAWFDKLPPGSIEFPKGEFQRKEVPLGQWGQGNERHQRMPYRNHRRRPEHRPTFRTQKHHAPYVPSHRPNQEFCRPRETRVVLTLDSLVSTPQKILATEHQLHLPQPAPLVGVPSKENINKCCDYQNEKGHSTNDCFHLKKQSEIALESGKLNHLVKDVRQKGKGEQWNNGSKKVKVINMVQYHDQKRKTTLTNKKWMNVPITFSPVLARDLSEEALVVEGEMEGPVKYPTWISNPVLVKKVDGIWRMCIDFKNINVACPKDYYPLPEIDSKIESVMGFPLKCFLDAYKGYHQVQMAEEDEEKTAYYTDQGKLAQYSVELGAYNITYDPRSAIKGWILANFINEVPVGSETMVSWQTHYTINRQTVCKEEWLLYTDGASSVKGSGAGLVLIS